jgi:hypothetical protein
MGVVGACEFTARDAAGIRRCVNRFPAAGWFTPARRRAVTAAGVVALNVPARALTSVARKETVMLQKLNTVAACTAR